MVLCDCILSETSLKHVKIIQKLLEFDCTRKSMSDTVTILLQYTISNKDSISYGARFLIDQYVLNNPSFLSIFNTDVSMSAISYSFHEV